MSFTFGKLGFGSSASTGGALPSSFSAFLSSLAATPGVGTATLTWEESGSPDTVNIYRDGNLEGTVTGGVNTWTSGTLDDGLYEWTAKPVKDSVEGAASNAATLGCMTADVWCDITNGSDSNDGSTPTLAVATLHKAGQLMDTPGMVLAVRGGTYAGYETNLGIAVDGINSSAFKTDGNASNRFYFKSFPGENVVLDGSGVTRADVLAVNPGSDAREPSLLHLGEYWTVQGWPGYRIRGEHSAGSIFSSYQNGNCQFLYVEGEYFNGDGVWIEDADDNEVAHFFFRAGLDADSGGNASDGISGAGGDGNYVHHGIVHYTSDDGVDFFTGTYSQVHHVLAYRQGYDASDDEATPNGNGNGFKLGSSNDPSPANQRNMARSCIAVNVLSNGFDTNGGGGILIENCISMGAEGNGYVVATYSNNIARNNVGYNDAQNVINSSPTEDHNSWNTPPGKAVTSASFLNTTFNEDWRTWEEVEAANFLKPDPNAPTANNLVGAGASGADLGPYVEDEAAPAAPTSLAATSGNAKVDLAWTLSADHDVRQQRIYRSTTSGTGYALVATVDSHTATYSDTGLTNGTTYYYVVKAVDYTGNESSASSEDSATPASAPTTVNAGIATSADDWFVWTPFAAGNFNSLDGVEVGNKADHLYIGPYSRPGLRFALDIPQGATITEAILTVTALNDRSAVGAVTIRAAAADNAAAATSLAEDTSLRASQTTASASWTIPATTGDTAYDSPDLKSILQEVVNRAGWPSTGGHIVLLFSTAGSDSMDAYSYEASSGSNAPSISVTYQVGLQAPSVAPTGHFVIAGAESATVHWGTAPEGATQVVVERKTTGSYSTVATVIAGDGSHADSGLTDGTTYTYRLSWSNATGAGPTSTEVVCVPWDEWKPLRGNESFAAASDLTPAARAWHDRITPYFAAPATLYEYVNFNPNDLYSLGRYFCRPVLGSIAALRLTGDLSFLDLADYGMQLARAELADQGVAGSGGGDGYLNWVWLVDSGETAYYNKDTHVLDSAMTHGLVAAYAWACQQNRDLTSPGGVDYGERADFWLSYLKNNFEPLWRGRNSEPTDVPWFGPVGLTHADMRFALDFDWHYWRLTGDNRYKARADTVYDDWRSDVVAVGGTSNDVWPLGSNTLVGRTRGVDPEVYWDLHNTGYVQYMAMDLFNAFCDGNPKVTETHLNRAANSVAQYILDNGTTDVSASIGGDGSLSGLNDNGEARNTAGQYFVGMIHWLSHWDFTGEIQVMAERFYDAQSGTLPAIDVSVAMLGAYQMGDVPIVNNASATAAYPDVSLSWSLPYDGGYTAWDNVLIYAGSDPDSLTLLDTLSASATTYTHDSAGVGTHYYQVRLKYGVDESFAATVSATVTSDPVTLNLAIASALDDGFVWSPYTSGYFNSTSGTDDTQSDHVYIGPSAKSYLRFVAAIPQGATITSATLTLTARNSRAAGPVVNVYGVNQDTAAAPTDASEVASLLANLTTAVVEWTLGATTGGTGYSPPDVKAVVQEIVDRPGWATGNALMFALLDNGSTGTADMESYEDWPPSVATLSVTYTP